MESIFWNVRGSNVPNKQLELSRFFRKHKPTFASLVETKLDAAGLSVLQRKLLKDSPWLVGGDFNEVRYSSEKSGGKPVHSRRLRKFNSCIDDSGLQDLKAFGHTLSWNNRQDKRIMCRLDRFLVHSSFINLFQHSIVNYLAPGISDHSPLKVSLEPLIPSSPKPFKYYEMWESHPHFNAIVDTAWKTKVRGSPMFRLVKKLSAVKLALKQWNRDFFGPIQQTLQRSTDKLSNFQAQLQQNPQDTILQVVEMSARLRYSSCLAQEKCFLRQKSRQLWLSSGDSNTKFFYDSIKARSVRNTISRLRSPNGVVFTQPKEIK
ncbi:hypothetical protein QJS04_geneDACA020390 [Acorus gramineus]|uniref:Endonuclease/exonuclease/phosphatase domain-containing protein n=1 Tax=Acorus gramineus TaxID=55184 RepID=A0AAV9A302_ACOGR|nr:hypothetical protein QJS04_geneDACA020390 [Acorus gramineus]